MSILSKKSTRIWISVVLIIQTFILLIYFGFVQYPRLTNKDQAKSSEMPPVSTSVDTIVRASIIQGASLVYHPELTDSGDLNKLINQIKFSAYEQLDTTENNSITNSSTVSISTTLGIVHSNDTKRLSKSDFHNYLKITKRIQAFLVTNHTFSFANNLGEWFPSDINFTTSFKFSKSKSTTQSFFIRSSNNISVVCLKEGTDYRSPQHDKSSSPCMCKDGWQGRHCSIPDTFKYSSAASYITSLKVRKSPKRIINAIAFNMEFDTLEARLHELKDVVDLFVIYESNYTLYGDPKPLRLFDRLAKGYLREFHNKIYYLFLGKFPVDSTSDGWYPERYARGYIGQNSMKHIVGAKPDDLFIYTDADEIPSHEALLFLKTNDGYPEPFGLSLRWSVFGYFWKQNSLTHITVGCSIRMFRYIYTNDAQNLRNGEFETVQSEILRTYLAGGGSLQRWNLGEGGIGNAGWHCSWCLAPHFIKIKLISAVNADFPRWGNYQEKLNLKYIKKLIQSGMWFDDETQFDSLVNNQTDINFAPQYVQEHWDKYKHILDIGAVR